MEGRLEQTVRGAHNQGRDCSKKEIPEKYFLIGAFDVTYYFINSYDRK